MRTGINSQLRACISPIYASRCSPFTSAVFFKHGMIIVAALLNMYPEDETSCTGLKEERMLQTTRPRSSLRRLVNMNRFRYFETRACRGKNNRQFTICLRDHHCYQRRGPDIVYWSNIVYLPKFVVVFRLVSFKSVGSLNAKKTAAIPGAIQYSINIQYLVHDIT
jgi:hypothetical protein